MVELVYLSTKALTLVFYRSKGRIQVRLVNRTWIRVMLSISFIRNRGHNNTDVCLQKIVDL